MAPARDGHRDARRRRLLERAQRLERRAPPARLPGRPVAARERLDRGRLRHPADPRRRAGPVGEVVLPREVAAAARAERREPVEALGQRARAAAVALGVAAHGGQAGAGDRVRAAPAGQRLQLQAVARVVLEDRGVGVRARAEAGRRQRLVRPEARVGAQDEEHRAQPVDGQHVRGGERAHGADHVRELGAAGAAELGRRSRWRSPSPCAGSPPARARSARSAARPATTPRPSASAAGARSRRAASARTAAGGTPGSSRPWAAARPAASPGAAATASGIGAAGCGCVGAAAGEHQQASTKTGEAGHPARVIGVRHGLSSVLGARAPKHARRTRIVGTLAPPECKERAAMQGLMQSYPLTLTHVFRRAERLFPEKGIATVTGGGIERTTYGEWAERTRRLAGVLDDLGISADGRVGTFAWNTARHLELYFAAPCSGRVLHTLNIRLFPDDIVYIADHAEDEVVFVDRSLLKLFWPLVERFETVKHVVVMDDGGGDEIPDDPRVHDYEALLAEARAGRLPDDRRREPGRRDVLHERHDRPPEGRRLLAPLDRPALDGLARGRRGGRLRARHDHAGGADVPRQRVGPVPGRGDGRRVAGDARPEHAAEGAGGADGVREGHAGGGRPDDLDGRPARARGPRSLLPTRDPVRRVRGAEVAQRGLPREDRACRSCRPGG